MFLGGAAAAYVLMGNDAAVVGLLDLWAGALLEFGSNLLALLGHTISSAAVTGGTLLGNDARYFITQYPSLSAVLVASMVIGQIGYGLPPVGF